MSKNTRLTNNKGVSLAMAVWLAHDDYDYADENVEVEGDLVSVTTFIQPTRKFILSQMVPKQEEQVLDVLDMLSSTMGTAIHNNVEHAWRNYKSGMKRLGYLQKIIDKVRINPDSIEKGTIPVFLEQRFYREIDGVTLSGKFDSIINGTINDTKTTSTYAWTSGNKDEDYRIQLSIYRWLNPEKIYSNIGYIQLVFTDWSKMFVGKQPNYPEHKLKELKIELMSLEETETWIKNKLREIRANIGIPQSKMVTCSEKELWMSEPKFKYYNDPEKAKLGGRSTRTFDTMHEAQAFKVSKGKGAIVPIKGEPKACGYCPAFGICQQKDLYQHD